MKTNGPPQPDEGLERLARAATRRSVDPHPDTDQLMQWADGAIGESEAEPILAHLGKCDDCREFVSELSSLPPSLVLVPPHLAQAQQDSLAIDEQPMAPVPIGSARKKPRPSITSRIAWLTAPLAAAAGVLFAVTRPAVVVMAPNYRAVLTGGITQMKAPAPSNTFAATSPFQLRLVPKEPVQDLSFGVLVAVSKESNAVRRLKLSTKSSSGVLSFHEDARKVFGEEPGRWNVYVLVSADESEVQKWSPDSSLHGAGVGPPVVEAFEIEYLGSEH